MSRFLLAAPLVAIVATIAAPATHAQTLQVGDPAPALAVSKWVKGGPITSLNDGKVHVVEFWATWCAPCRETIPHLSQLAARFKGQAEFTGVSIWEPDQKRVRPFVTQMGSRMAYNVGMDTVSGPGEEAAHAGATARAWMEAAGQESLPTTFVVDKQGKIAWIGHPLDDLDVVVSKVAAGTWDAKAEAEKKVAEQARIVALNQKAEEIMALVQSGKVDEAMTQYNAVNTEDPRFGFVFGIRGLYPALLRRNETAAYALAKTIAANDVAKNNPNALGALAWLIVAPESVLKTPDTALAVSLAERAATLTKNKNPIVLDTLALAYFKNGDKAKAIATQEKAVALVKAEPKAPPQLKKEILNRLAQFKKG